MKYAYVTERTKGLGFDEAFTDGETLFAVLKAGDTVVIPYTMDGLFTSDFDLLEFLERLRAMDVIILLPEANLDTSTEDGKIRLRFFMSMVRNLAELHEN